MAKNNYSMIILVLIILGAYLYSTTLTNNTNTTDTAKTLCEKAGGLWNECVNRCPIDSAPGANCPPLLKCVPSCQCGGIVEYGGIGGIMGYKCPSVYPTCKITRPDGLGYCI